jgi:hypothetical protein
MSDGKRRRERFFAEHPRCCFCAGEAGAVEEDHQPGRVFFRDRVWPEGFCFPACANCNRVSRDAENLTSILVTDTSTERSHADFKRRVESVRSNYPGLLPDLAMNTRTKRNALSRMGLQKLAGTLFRDLPLIKIDQLKWRPIFQLIGHKLMLALHYKCFDQPLSRGGGIWLSITTNVQTLAGSSHSELLAIAERYIAPIRSRQPLQDQFAIRWGSMMDPRMALFIASLQNRLIFYGITTESPELIALADENPGEMLRPFTW